MTEQLDTLVADAATEAPTHGVVLTDVAAQQGQEPARAGGPRRPAAARSACSRAAAPA